MPNHSFPRKRAINQPDLSNGLDSDDRFVLLKVAGYIDRILARYPIFDRPLIDALVWILGPNMAEFGQALCEESLPGTRQEFFDELNECMADPDEYDGVIIRHVTSRKALSRSRAIKITQLFLERRQKELTFRGHSELEKNTAAIQLTFGLSDLEIELCLIFFIMSAYNRAEQFLENHLELERFEGRKYLRTMLGISAPEMSALLQGRISKLEMMQEGLQGLFSLSSEFIDFFQHGQKALYKCELFNRITGPSIPLDFHPIETEVTQHLLRLLAKATESSTHILFYGNPGTGKTSYAKGLIAKLAQPGFEIGLDSDQNTTNKRRNALLACLNLTQGGTGGIIIMDEADNVLNTQGSWFMRGETQDKGWLNHVLELPGVRMIWLTNDVSAIDDSVLRRFAISICFLPFSRAQRVNLWRNILRRRRCKRMLTEQDVKNLAVKYEVNAGVADLAVIKAKEAAGDNKLNFRQGLELALESHLALKNGGIRPRYRNEVETNYSIEGLNTEGNIQELIRNLKLFDAYLRSNCQGQTNLNMNLLFFGPPGCGKSELARYIGHALDRELMVKRVSDILDPYVGMTEQKIASAFAGAEAGGSGSGN